MIKTGTPHCTITAATVIMSMCHNVSLGGDIMKIIKIPFLVTINHLIRFGTLELLSSQKMPTIFKARMNVCNLCQGRGFCVTVVMMDSEFESLQGNLGAHGILMNAVSREEHAPDTKRCIRTLKERTRSTSTPSLSKRSPKWLCKLCAAATSGWLCFQQARCWWQSQPTRAYCRLQN